MNSQSIFNHYIKTGLFFAAALFFMHGSVQAAEARSAVECDTEPCQLTPLEKHWERHPETQWPPSRREQLKRCDKINDRHGSEDCAVEEQKTK